MALPDIFDYDDFPSYLDAWYKAKRALNRHYTHRVFTEEAGQSSSGILNLLLGGKRHLTPHLVSAVRKPLGLDDAGAAYLGLMMRKADAERAHALAMARHAAAQLRKAEPRRGARPSDVRRRGKVVDNAIQGTEATLEETAAALRSVREEIAASRALHRAELLDEQRLAILSHWSTAALAELARCRGFRRDPHWAAVMLRGRADPATLAQGLALLDTLGALPPEGEGPAVRLPDTTTGYDAEAKNLRAYYEGVYAQAGLALAEHFNPAARDAQDRARLGASTVAVPSAAVPRFRAVMLDIHKQLHSFLVGLEGDPDVVYQLYVHLFPLSEVCADDRE